MAIAAPRPAPRAAVPARPARPSRPSWAGELRATLALGLPLVAAQLAQIAINTTDTLMMGRLGPEALAAGALGTTLLFLPTIAGIGLTAAVSAIVAQERGARPSDVRGPRRTVRQGLWAVTLLGLPGLVLLWYGDRVLLLIGQDPALVGGSLGYLRTAMWGFLPTLWFLVLRAFVSATERATPILLITLGGVAVNAGANWLLMFGHYGLPALGIRGTGIATALTNTAMLIALAAFIARDRRLRRYRLAGRLWRPDREKLATVFRIGLPISGLLVAEVGGFAASTAMAGRIGADTLAAHAIALQIASVTFMVPLGLSQATTVRVGLAAGRGAGVALAGRVSLALGCGFAALAAVLMLLAPGALVSAFIDPSAAAAALAITFVGVAAVFQLVDAAQVILAAALRGLGDTGVPLVMGLIGYWGIGLPLGATLAFGGLGAPLGGLGVWIGLASGLASVAVLLGWRWRRDVAAWREDGALPDAAPAPPSPAPLPSHAETL